MQRTSSNSGVQPWPISVQAFWLYAVCFLLFCVSVAATVYFCRSMAGGMEMPGGWTMSMMWMRMPGQTWAGSFAMFLEMWVAMMVAMMLPSAMPLFTAKHSGTESGPRTANALAIMAGYFGVWTAVGVLVYAIGFAWSYATMRWTWLSRLVPGLIGAALIVSGLLQFSRWKMAGLMRCRDPLSCAAAKAECGCRPALSQGFGHGTACVVCCAGPMLILLVLGAMNLFVMLLVTLLITLEKLLPQPRLVVRVSGVACVLAGLFILARQLF